MLFYLSPISNGISFYYPDEKQPAGIYEWDSVVSAWRTSDAIYLYLTETQALLIPDNDKNRDMNVVWNLIEKKLDSPRLHKKKTSAAKADVFCYKLFEYANIYYIPAKNLI